MGYLGSHLEDYFSYELLEEVEKQIDSDDTGDWGKLLDRLNRVVKKVASRNEQIGKSPNKNSIKG